MKHARSGEHGFEKGSTERDEGVRAEFGFGEDRFGIRRVVVGGCSEDTEINIAYQTCIARRWGGLVFCGENRRPDGVDEFRGYAEWIKKLPSQVGAAFFVVFRADDVDYVVEPEGCFNDQRIVRFLYVRVEDAETVGQVIAIVISTMRFRISPQDLTPGICTVGMYSKPAA